MENEEIVTVLVQIEYTVLDNEMPYSDIIVMEAEEYLALTPEEIEQIKLDKYNEWKNIMLGGVVSGK
jgi:hypothetical protein